MGSGFRATCFFDDSSMPGLHKKSFESRADNTQSDSLCKGRESRDVNGVIAMLDIGVPQHNAVQSKPFESAGCSRIYLLRFFAWPCNGSKYTLQ